MVKTELTAMFLRIKELNEKIDNNNKLLNDVLKLLNEDVKKRSEKKTNTLIS
jgi:hypothetical protein